LFAVEIIFDCRIHGDFNAVTLHCITNELLTLPSENVCISKTF